MAKENKELVVAEEKALVQETEPRVGRGLEDADMEGISFPRTKIMQPTSPELADHEELRMGDLVNDLTFEKLPKKFVPVMAWDSNILFSPKSDKPDVIQRLVEEKGLSYDDMASNQILCRSVDGKAGDRFGNCKTCGLCAFDNVRNLKPAGLGTVNVLVLFEGIDVPIIMQFSATSQKHGKKFKQMMMFGGGDIFKNKYEYAMEKRSQDTKTWFELKVKPAGKATQEEFGNAEMWHSFARMQRDTINAQAMSSEEFKPVDEPNSDVPF